VRGIRTKKRQETLIYDAGKKEKPGRGTKKDPPEKRKGSWKRGIEKGFKSPQVVSRDHTRSENCGGKGKKRHLTTIDGGEVKKKKKHKKGTC